MTKNKSKTTSILFIDSGIGGLSTLSTAFLPNKANYIYFADNKFSPYGSKSVDFLQQRLFDIIRNLSKKYSFKIVVLACNTATTTSISFLREQFPNLLIIGTEPAFKIALDKGFKHPAIIATPQTISHLKHKNLKRFLMIPNKDLAKIIEENLTFSSIKSKLKLLKMIYKIKNQTKKCDCIVLGCTHYVFIKELISKTTNLPIYDGNLGVTKQILRKNQPFTTQNSSFKLLLSDKNHILLQKYKKILGQILANQINLW